MTDREPRAPLPPIDGDVSGVREDEPVSPEPEAAAAGPEPQASAAGPEPAVPHTATRPETSARVLAYVIDWVIAMALYGVFLNVSFLFGGLLGAAYLLLRDGFELDFMRGRSLGKRMMKLKVVRLDGGAMDFMTSARRNWTLAFSMLPLGLFFFLFLWPVALLLGLFEAFRLFTSPAGRRWGDELAGTRVVMAEE